MVNALLDAGNRRLPHADHLSKLGLCQAPAVPYAREILHDAVMRRVPRATNSRLRINIRRAY